MNTGSENLTDPSIPPQNVHVTMYQTIVAAVRNCKFQPQFILFGFQSDLDKIIAANPGVVDTGKAVTADGVEVTFQWFKNLGVLIGIAPGIDSFELTATVPQKVTIPNFKIIDIRKP